MTYYRKWCFDINLQTFFNLQIAELKTSYNFMQVCHNTELFY
jgi:hypothetical protein